MPCGLWRGFGAPCGDALLTLAFEVLSDKDNFRTLEADRLLLMIKLISEKAGAKGMVGGQVMDIRKLGELEHISLKKTAELFLPVLCWEVWSQRGMILSMI